MSRTFIPAAGSDLLLPLYDPLWRLIGGGAVRATFIREAGLAAGQRILDIGCGTGSLAVDIASRLADTQVSALDPDPKALARGRAKAARTGVDVRWSEGFADALPYEDGAFDRVVSSFMFHHLDLEVKQGMLREARRVLESGAELHLLDLGGQHSGHDGWLGRMLHTHDHLADNQGGRIGELFEAAGLEAVREVSHGRSIFGRYAHTVGVAP